MKPNHMLRVFTDRYPLVGPALWMLSLQYFIVQIVVALDWSMPYSLAHNTISDLGNTACAAYAGRFVCSPLSSLMDASFVLLGVTMLAGSSLIYQEFHKNRGAALGFSAMALAGLGTAFVGLFPENSVPALHTLGAALPFLVGNLGIVLLGSVLRLPKLLRLFSLASGGLALVALIFFTTGHYLGLGEGGMERVTAYPQTIWLVTFGIYMSKSHSSNTRV